MKEESVPLRVEKKLYRVLFKVLKAVLSRHVWPIIVVGAVSCFLTRINVLEYSVFPFLYRILLLHISLIIFVATEEFFHICAAYSVGASETVKEIRFRYCSIGKMKLYALNASVHICGKMSKQQYVIIMLAGPSLTTLLWICSVLIIACLYPLHTLIRPFWNIVLPGLFVISSLTPIGGSDMEQALIKLREFEKINTRRMVYEVFKAAKHTIVFLYYHFFEK